MRGIIFDCDGTLVDSEETHYLAWRNVLQELGHLLEEQFYIDHFCGVGDIEAAERVGALLGWNDLDELIRRKNNAFDVYRRAGIRPIPETVAFALRLFKEKEKRGLKFGLASGARKEEILHHLTGIGINSFFDVILSGKDDLSEYRDPEGTNKPKPYVYLKTAKMLGFVPEECIAIEDSRIGIKAAVSAGCFTIAVPNAFTKHHDLSQAHLQIDSFAGISVDEFFAMILKR